MYLCTRLLEQFEGIEELSYNDLYPWLITEYKEARGYRSQHHGRHFFDAIWDAKAPRSNIYRYLGLSHMHRHISHDLWCQLEELADKHIDVFKHYTSNRTERAELMLEALKKTKVVNSPEKLDPGEQPLQGFLPLQEFLESRVEIKAHLPWGDLWLVPTDEEKKVSLQMGLSMASIVFTIQVMAPLFMVMNGWISETNWLRRPGLAWKAFTFPEITCIGTNQVQRTMTLVGSFLSYVVLFIIRAEVRKELNDIQKASRSLNSPFWFMFATTSGTWSCFFLIIAVPFIFWAETNIVSMVCDSMGILFIYSLDDLSDVVFNYLGLGEEDYKRVASWSCILLTKCPLYLSDVVNPTAKSLDEFWRINFDQKGNLLNTSKERCETRLQEAHSETPEAQPLLGSDTECALVYKNRGYQRFLPSMQNKIAFAISYCLSIVLAILHPIIPIVFFIINDPCDSQGIFNYAPSLTQIGAAVWSHDALRIGAWNHTAI